jgi:hypothetical protein
MSLAGTNPPKPAPGWLRLLTPSDAVVPAGELALRLAGKVGSARLCVDAGQDAQWDELLLTHANWRGIARVERRVVASGSPAERELDAFAAALAHARPAAGAAWVRDYLARVRMIYTCQPLPGACEGDGLDAVAAVRNALWARLDGVLQADDRGFTNEGGCQVVWQVPAHLAGSMWMAVRQADAWVNFEMALDDPARRAHFLRGEVPPGVRLAR